MTWENAGAAARLLRFELGNGEPPPRALEKVYQALYGNNPHRMDRIQFLRLAAPLARRITLSVEAPEHVLMNEGGRSIRVKGVRDWYTWLTIASEERSAQIADLHYWAGLPLRQVCRVLDLPVSLALDELRDAKKVAASDYTHAKVRWRDRAVYPFRALFGFMRSWRRRGKTNHASTDSTVTEVDQDRGQYPGNDHPNGSPQHGGDSDRGAEEHPDRSRSP